MIEQISNSVTFFAHYVASKIGVTGLTVTVDVWEVQKDGTAAEIVTAGSATEIGDGLYRYLLASGSVDEEGEYIAVFKTTDSSVDQQHLPAVWSIQRAGVETLDAAVSSRSTVTTAEVNTEVDQALADYDGPTKAELDTAQASIEGDIAALENLSAAEVNTEVDQALADYDGPTKAELDSAITTVTDAIAALNNLDAVAVWEYVTRTLTSGGGASAADIWAYATRTLTQGAASVSAAVSGSSVTVYRGTTWAVSLTGLGSLSNYDVIYLSVKRGKNEDDNDAILRVTNSALERVNKAAPTSSSNGIITVDDAANGDITITVNEAETKNMPVQANLYYDVKGVDNDGNTDEISAGGLWTIEADITRKVA